MVKTDRQSSWIPTCLDTAMFEYCCQQKFRCCCILVAQRPSNMLCVSQGRNVPAICYVYLRGGSAQRPSNMLCVSQGWICSTSQQYAMCISGAERPSNMLCVSQGRNVPAICYVYLRGGTSQQYAMCISGADLRKYVACFHTEIDIAY